MSADDKGREEGQGMYYTPEHIADLASGSGAFLKEAAEVAQRLDAEPALWNGKEVSRGG